MLSFTTTLKTANKIRIMQVKHQLFQIPVSGNLISWDLIRRQTPRAKSYISMVDANLNFKWLLNINPVTVLNCRFLNLSTVDFLAEIWVTLCPGPVLCVCVGGRGLAASLGSTHYTQYLLPVVTTQNVSGCSQMSPQEQNQPTWELLLSARGKFIY